LNGSPQDTHSAANLTIKGGWALLFIEIHRIGGLRSERPTHWHSNLHHGDPTA
jgi:hypothetical protein